VISGLRDAVNNRETAHKSVRVKNPAINGPIAPPIKNLPVILNSPIVDKIPAAILDDCF